MFELISSMSGVLVLALCFYIFRRNIKQAQEALPEVASSIINPVIKGAKQFDLIVTTNCNENTIDLVKRTHTVREQLDELKLNSVKEAEEYILGVR